MAVTQAALHAAMDMYMLHCISPSTQYRIAGNICGNLVMRSVVVTKNVQFYSAQYYFHAICVGVIRRGSDRHVLTCTEVQRGMALFRETCPTTASPLYHRYGVQIQCGLSSSLQHCSSSWSVGFHVALQMWCPLAQLLIATVSIATWSHFVWAYIITPIRQPLLSYVGVYSTARSQSAKFSANKNP